MPAVFLNGEPFGQGRMTLEQVVAELDDAEAERAAEALQDKPPFDVLAGSQTREAGLRRDRGAGAEQAADDEAEREVKQ